MLTAAAAVCTVLLAPPPGRGQNDEKARPISAAKAQNNARHLELDATYFTVFDRQGKAVATVGPRELYRDMALSPDGKRLAAVKEGDIWVFNVATGAGTRLTFSQRRERAAGPVWSPDGARVAFVGVRSGNFGIYRKAANGQGAEELLYQSPGTPGLADWSMDGRFLSFFSSTPFGAPDLSGGILSVLPLDGAERKPVEVYRTPKDKQLSGGWFSPDSRLLTYLSNESGRNELYVRRRDSAAGAGPWQVSTQGAVGGGVWGADGKELYYVAPDQGVMAVEVSTSPAVSFGKPKLLFRPPAGKFRGFSISRDGARILMAATPPSRMRQITIFDRQGKVVRTVGQPGVYINGSISLDGTRVAVGRTDLKTANLDIWTFDLSTGKGHAVTSDVWEDFDPAWSPDGKQVAYVSSREQCDCIYRKAWDGRSREELLFQSATGSGIELANWSPDGRFLTLNPGAISVVPLHTSEKALDRKALDWLREEYDADGGWFSPDMRYLAYLSNEDDVDVKELYVRSFDESRPNAPGPGPAVKVSNKGVLGGVYWRKDGKEITWVNRDMKVVAVEVTTTPTLQVGPPKILFKLPGLVASGGSRDGQRFVFLIPLTQSAPPR